MDAKQRLLDYAGISQILSEPLPEAGKTRLVRDTEIPYFYASISPKGGVTFYLIRKHKGKYHRKRVRKLSTEDDVIIARDSAAERNKLKDSGFIFFDDSSLKVSVKSDDDSGANKSEGRAINLIRKASGCSISSAREALKQFNGDVVKAERFVTGQLDPPLKVNAAWAKFMRSDNEAAGHAMAARILELAEPAITQAIRKAAWRAMEEILGSEDGA